VVLLLAVIPTWLYSSGWGYYPSGLLAVLLVVVIVLLPAGVLRSWRSCSKEEVFC
jgi:hypothetical protein